MCKSTKPDCEYQSKKYHHGQIPSIQCDYKISQGFYSSYCDYEQEEEDCPIKKLLEENQQLKEQLKQSEEVIDEINKFIEDNGICKEMAEACRMYDVNGIEVYEILQRYKGDNK